MVPEETGNQSRGRGGGLQRTDHASHFMKSRALIGRMSVALHTRGEAPTSRFQDGRGSRGPVFLAGEGGLFCSPLPTLSWSQIRSEGFLQRETSKVLSSSALEDLPLYPGL